MILGVDPAMATCGWAIVAPRTGLIRRCGVITTTKKQGVPLGTDRARRVAHVAAELADLAYAYQCTTIAAEAPLGFGSIHAVAPQQLVWGALISLGVARNMPVLEVPAKVWQHAVMPGVKRIDYAELERVLYDHVGAESEALDGIPNDLLTHALDAAGVGVLAAVRPQAATAVIGDLIAFHDERAKGLTR